jgi:hypothetical protein
MAKSPTGPGIVTEAGDGGAGSASMFLLANFDINDSTLKYEHTAYLDARVLPLLTADPTKQLVLVGRASDTGGEADNDGIADGRATSVLDYVSERGIRLARMVLGDPVRASGLEADTRAVRVELRPSAPTVVIGPTYAGPAAPCGTPGNPKCGDPKARAAGLSPLVKKVDAAALSFGARLNMLDPNRKMTILDTTVAIDAKQRLEHAAGIVIDANDEPRLTRTSIGDLDTSQPDINKELKAGDRVVGTIHSHPGGAGAENFSAGDIATAKAFAADKDNQEFIHPKVGVLYYLLTPKSSGGNVLVFDVRRNTVTEVR